MTQTIRTHVPVPGIGPDCDVHVRTASQRFARPLNPPATVETLTWLAVYSHPRKTWVFPCTQQSVTAALAAAKVVLR